MPRVGLCACTYLKTIMTVFMPIVALGFALWAPKESASSAIQVRPTRLDRLTLPVYGTEHLLQLTRIEEEPVEEQKILSVLLRFREGEQLEAKDLQLVLEKNWNMRLPGVGDTSELKAIKKTSSTEVHRQRLQMVRRRGR